MKSSTQLKKKLIIVCCNAKLFGKECICSTIIKTGNKWLESYQGNNNTGNEYEICTGLSILLGAGLTTKEELPEIYKEIQQIKSNKVKGLINLTQKDNIGGTSDIGIVFKNNKIKYYSITQWKGQMKKCIFNPSGSKYYGLLKNSESENNNDHAFKIAIDHRKNCYGVIPNKKWKRTPSCPGCKYMCEYMALDGSKSWMAMDIDSRKEKLTKMLDLNGNRSTNANGIIYWNKKKNRIENIYKWELKINLDDYLNTYNEGIYIYHGIPGDTILKTQCKYNNGIIEGMSSKINPENWNPQKSKNYLSSWDSVAQDLSKIFKMEKVNLLE